MSLRNRNNKSEIKCLLSFTLCWSIVSGCLHIPTGKVPGSLLSPIGAELSLYPTTHKWVIYLSIHIHISTDNYTQCIAIYTRIQLFSPFPSLLCLIAVNIPVLKPVACIWCITLPYYNLRYRRPYIYVCICPCVCLLGKDSYFSQIVLF